jgi:hypothetical protein
VCSLSQAAYGIYAANNVAARVGGVALADVREGCRVAEYVECLLQLREIVGADQHRRDMPVTGEDDALMLMLNTIDHLAEVVADRT